MANGKTHEVVGTLAGAGFAYWAARDQSEDARMIELIGGALGGFVGGKLPDIFDPPTHPGHRSVAHAIAPLAVAAQQCMKHLRDWQETVRRMADHQAHLRAQAQDPSQQAWHEMLELAYRLIAGMIAGLIAGYASHIALDAVTPSGLPVLL